MKPLDGVSVLVTRPADQCEELAQAIEDLGGIALRTPMLVVAGLSNSAAAKSVVATTKDAEIAIFVSKNAVDFGLDLLKSQRQTLEGKQVYAVGLGTAGSLRAQGVENVQVPNSEFSSEGLLRIGGLSEQNVAGKQVVIFRGVGGRELLAKTLVQRGAEVVYCECYERRKPVAVIGEALQKHKIKVPDIGLATSLESFENLIEKIEEEGLERLFDMQMLVVGSRVGQEVESLGFTHHPMVVENPSDESIIKRLIKWADDEL